MRILLNKLFLIKVLFTKKIVKSTNLLSLNYYKFNQDLEKKTNTLQEKFFYLRFFEIYRIIKKYKIKSVLEIGTGRTTFIFNNFKNLKVISMEQDKNWEKKIRNSLNKYKIIPKIIFEKVIEYKKGAKFKSIPNFNPDLMYIDGPYLKYKIKKFKTFTNKPAYYDFETLFKKKIFPKIIMIEGRTDTVDEIKNSFGSKKYKFIGEFTYNMQRKKYFSALKLKRHSLFILKY